MPKYFTKSSFAMSLECPRMVYYAYDNEHYANQDVNDDFLKSLAEGGFQVGEFAKLCYGIGPANLTLSRWSSSGNTSGMNVIIIF